MSLSTLALAGTLLAACSSGGSASSGGGGGGGDVSVSNATVSARALSQASAAVAALERAPGALQVPSLPRRPRAGGRIDFIECAEPICAAQGRLLGQAAAAAGWRLEAIPAGSGTPALQAAYSRALSQRPQGVIGSGGNPASGFSGQLAALKARHIPVVLYDAEAEVPGVTADIGGALGQSEAGEAIGQWIFDDARGRDIHLGLVGSPSGVYPISHAAVEEVAHPGECIRCTVEHYPISLADVGSKVPEEIVHLLRYHPEINYLFIDTAQELQGVAAALRAAHLAGKVKLATTEPGVLETAPISAGEVAVAAPDPTPEAFWGMVDIILRADEGAPIAPSLKIAYPKVLLTAHTKLGPEGGPTSGFETAFKTAWHTG